MLILLYVLNYTFSYHFDIAKQTMSIQLAKYR
nr:MAG TPA: hypothetical protein [Caudoviricetes sp.]